MKKWKQQIADEVISRCADLRIVSLRDVALSMGYNHIKSDDCRHIAAAVVKAVPGYEAVKLLTAAQSRNPSSAGLFSTLVFTCLEFCDEDYEEVE